MKLMRGGAVATLAVAVSAAVGATFCGSRAAYADGVPDSHMIQSLSNGLCLTNHLGLVPVFTPCQYTQHGYAVSWETWVQSPVAGTNRVRLWNERDGCLRFDPGTGFASVAQCDFSPSADLTEQWYLTPSGSGWTIRTACGWSPYMEVEPGASRPSFSYPYSDLRAAQFGL
jgi:hypothetical protein